MGMWRLAAQTREPEDLRSQIDEVLEKLTKDLDVWAELQRDYRIDLFSGLLMGSAHDGISLPPQSLLALGKRGIELALDVYDAAD